MGYYPRPPIKEKINNKDISIVGVYHLPNFFLKYRTFFENLVSQHDAIVLEQSIENFWEHPFFGKIAGIAYAQKKRVYQADPTSIPSQIVDATSCGVGMYLILNSIKKPKRKISRREFLKRIGLAGIGAFIFFGSTPGFALRRIHKESADSYGIDDILSYGNVDYRNIKIAEGIEKICHEVNDIEKIVAFHGGAHSKHMEAYLKNPALRAKKLAYLPFEVISRKKVREYIPTKEGWVLSRTF